MVNFFGKSKDKKQMQEDQIQENQFDNIVLSTLPTCNRPFEVIGLVASRTAESDFGLRIFTEDIRRFAHNLNADAVIGITFQTGGLSDSFFTRDYDASAFFVNTDNEHRYSRVVSTMIGTAIRYID
ncbi:hypothetical protein E2R51_16230 [Jeotgalibacillus sp. S-D1]|uniref:hypothetical protein n=1 Tax=Jeotgalibacillus sp. S-D1 TaxID=2552189 RepID=UPI00105A3E2F|nr:hypothetical protein [Jeotgalibacillus sp. S-D1]TDL30877.1 hypothetical protein E2R51_16230 [Jeotgalibacillus sp. S-D1]